jgi:DNA adenine methylase Dam
MQGPFQYTGNKFRIVDKILSMIPKGTNTLFELFGGSGVLGLNAIRTSTVSKVHYNELNWHVHNLFHQIMTDDNFAPSALKVMSAYPETKEHFYMLRSKYNQCTDNFEKACLLYNIISRSFSNDIRFNGKGEVNIPYGDRCYTNFDNLAEVVALDRTKISTSNGSYIDVIMNARPGDLVFVDPPYINTTATYNSGWTAEHENELYAQLDKLTSNGVNWMLTNTLLNRGNENKILGDWLNRTSGLYQVDSGTQYGNSSFRKSAAQSLELIVTNYEPEKELNLLDLLVDSRI